MAAARKTLGQKRADRRSDEADREVDLGSGDRIDTLIAELNKKMGGRGLIQRSSNIVKQQWARRSTGVMSLDVVLNGGLPCGGLVELGGPFSSGKTTIALKCCAQEQRVNGGAVAWVALEPFSKRWARENGYFIPFNEELAPDPEGNMVPIDSFEAASSLEKLRMEQAGITDPYAEVSPFVLIQEERGDVALDVAVKLLKSNEFAIIVVDSLGVAKCLGLGTGVLMYDGSVRKVEDVQEGDLLMGPDSTPRTVLSTTRGRGQLYRVDPKKGDSWVCNENHVLTLTHSLTGEVRDIPLPEYLALPYHARDYWKQTFHAVKFPKQPRLPVEPYFVGLWFGDGTKDLASVSITNMDPEVEEYLEGFASRWGLQVVASSKQGTRAKTYRLTTIGHAVRWTKDGPVGQNPLLHTLREVVGDQERIPAAYLRSSRKERLELLAGLVDTDGTYGNGCFSITQKRRLWAEDIAFLGRSLGFRATINANPVNGSEYWRVCISGDLREVPTRITRKQAKPRKQAKRVNRTGIEVTPIGEGEYAGFTIDGDHRFLLADFSVTHNSSKWIEEQDVQDFSDYPREPKMLSDYTARCLLALNTRYDRNNRPSPVGDRMNQTSVLHINQIVTKVGTMARSPWKLFEIKGGEGNKHNHHAIVFVWRTMREDLKTAWSSDKDYVYAQQVNFYGLKSKLGPPMLEGCADFYVQPYGHFQPGDFNVARDVVTWALISKVGVERNGAWFTIGENRFQGKEAVEAYLTENPDELARLYHEVLSALRS